MKKILIITLFFTISFCNAQDLINEVDDTGPVVLRYTFRQNSDSLVKPDFFNVYFVLEDAVSKSIYKRRVNIDIIPLETVFKNFTKKLTELNIDTTGLKIISYADKSNTAYQSYEGFKQEKIFLKVLSLKDVKLLWDSLKIDGLVSIIGQGQINKSKDIIERDMLKRALIKADSIAKSYALSQGIKFKTREKVSTYYYFNQKTVGTLNNFYYDLNLNDFTYTLSLDVSYVFE